jgi:hypothetical protein
MKIKVNITISKLYVSPMLNAYMLVQGGGKNFRLASLAICHPPNQNAEFASESQLSIFNIPKKV